MTMALIGKEDSIRASARVAVVSPSACAELTDAVVAAGHEVETYASWGVWSEQATATAADLVFCDEALVDQIPAGVTAPVLRIGPTGFATGEGLSALLELSTEFAACQSRLRALEHVVEGLRSGDAIVGNTPVMRRLQSAVSRAAECDATVLIEGPPGAGKSLAARVIHLKSRRSGKSVVVRECETLTADELNKALQACAETTLVLESVDRLPANAQAALVKHLKERSTARVPSLVRLVATTSAHIPEQVARGAFREDLFYRLHTFPILVPGLHERIDDVQQLAETILNSSVSETGRSHAGITEDARMLLENMQWPGNVAQLEATIRRSEALAAGAPIDREHVLAPASAAPATTASSGAAPESSPKPEGELTEDCIRPFEEEEKYLLGRALQATKGNVRRAAQLLGIGRATLYRKIQQYHLRLH